MKKFLKRYWQHIVTIIVLTTIAFWFVIPATNCWTRDKPEECDMLFYDMQITGSRCLCAATTELKEQ